MPSPLPAELHIEELSRFVSGRARLRDAAFFAWHDAERGAIIKAFLRETNSVHVADDGREVKVFFSVPLADSVTKGMSDAHNWHGQTMKRVRLLRLLFPNREEFGAQGLGLEYFVEQMQHDPTSKQIPVKSLPLERSVRLNAIFGSLVAYRHSRPDTWREYADSALTFRQAASECFRELHRGWAKLLAESRPRPSTIMQMPGREMGRLEELSKLPMFPRSAVDEWGFLSEEKQDKHTPIETMQQRSLRRFDAWRKAFSDFESGIGVVAGKILNLTVLYLSEHKGYVVTEEDDKTGHLLLANLGAAWNALLPMQREFRARFGSLYSQQQLHTLEVHERSNFRHLWAVAFAMHYERRRHLPNIGQMVAAEIGRRRANFLQSLNAEVNAALGDSGTATVREAQWILHDTPHLCIVCDYHGIASIEATLPNAIKAVWRAAQAGGWRPLEWKPLEVEWPKIALINLVCGKALLPACATVSTAVFFATSEGFEVKPHHYMALPIRPEDFTRGGFTVCESPLLRAFLALQGDLLAFALTNARFFQLATLILEKRLDKDDADRTLAEFSGELRTVLTVAQRSYAEAVQILETVVSQDKGRWMGELRRLCQFLLFDLDVDSTVTIDSETFASWTEGLKAVNGEFQKLTSEIVSFALGIEVDGSDMAARPRLD